MPNPYFRFKQFTIVQDRCAMKVGTDGVLLGAWTDTTGTQQILDIGTGTGLIALMMAQRSQAQIDAVDIDENACIQARENVLRSPWSEQIRVYYCSVQDYATTCPKRYDLLVSNPPFFENADKPQELARTVARHSDFLQQVDILQVAQQLLHGNGRLAVIYPPEQAKIFEQKANALGFFSNRKLCVKPKSDQTKRILMELGKSKSEYQETTIVLEADRHVYTPEFVALIKDFYLKY